MKLLTSNTEGKVIRFGIVIFWTLFWLFNVIDKFIGSSTFLWVGRDRLPQFVKYFSSIGIENQSVAFGFLTFITIAEVIAFILLVIALWHLVLKNNQKARTFFFWGTFTGLAIFSLFSIGDQIFGDRHELLEHTIYWVALIVSWWAYAYFPKSKVG
tara:strand:- start:113 stop:580 length:468 start_codon:yes stop_codon:yes gene_type:complete